MCQNAESAAGDASCDCVRGGGPSIDEQSAAFADLFPLSSPHDLSEFIFGRETIIETSSGHKPTFFTFLFLYCFTIRFVSIGSKY